MAAAASAALIVGTAGASIATWIGVSVIFWLLAVRVDAARLGRWGRIVTGILMLLTVAVHLTLSGGATSTDGIVWIVNAVVLTGGAMLLWLGRGKASSSTPSKA